MLLRANDDPQILEVLSPKTCKHTHQHVQNEQLQTIALHQLRTIASNISESGYFALESDEVTNSTRWTVHGASLEIIRLKYETLQATWEGAVTFVHETKVKSRINGNAAIMQTFNFLFGLMLAE